MLTSALVALSLLADPAPDDGPSPAETKLLLESLLPAERSAVQKAVGDLSKLPLYRVQATVDTKTSTFSGDVQLRYPTGQGIRELPLRTFANASYISHGAPAVTVESVTCPGQVCAMSQPGDGTLQVITFDPPLPADAVARVNLSFHGALPVIDPSRVSANAQMSAQAQLMGSRGGSPSDHGGFASAEGVLGLTGMFPTVAQRSAEGFDTSTPIGVGENAAFDLANYLFTVRTAGGATVVAGGTKLGEAPTPDGQTQATYAAAVVRDLPVYVSHRLVATTAQSGAVKVTAYTLPGDELMGKKVLDVAVRALKDFSRRFGSYPWRDFKVVEQPMTDGAGGLEHPTVVSIGSLLYRTQSAMGPLAALATPQQQLGSHTAKLGVPDKVLEFSVAHAVARQWWGSLVGSNGHLDPVSDEALSQYSGILYLETRRGHDAAKDALDNQIAVGYQMMRQAGEPDGIVDQPTAAFASPLQFQGLLYGKAPLFYGAARKKLGDGVFDKVLSRYRSRNRFHTLPPGAFVAAVREVAPKQADAISTLRERWLTQTHGDEDVGQLDFGKVLESSTGMKMSPQGKAMMQQLMPQLMQMMKSGVGAPPPGQLQPGQRQNGNVFQP